MSEKCYHVRETLDVFHFDIREFNIQELIHTLEGACDYHVVFEFHVDYLAHQCLEE